MIKYVRYEDHPLRIYLEGDPLDISKIMNYVHSTFYVEKDYDVDEVDNIIFVDRDDTTLVTSYYFPKGLYHILDSMIKKLHIDISPESYYPESEVYEDVSISEDILENIILRPYQVSSVESALKYKYGIIQVSTGGGKTEIVLAIIRYLYSTYPDGNYIICVPSTKLLYQTYQRALDRGFDETNLSILGDGNSLDIDKHICICTVQTLVRRLYEPEYEEWFSNMRALIMDEAHHCSARTFFTVVDALHAEYTLGVTAEPFYNDKDHKIQDLIVRGALGPVLYRILVPQLVELGYLSKPYLITFPTQSPKPSMNMSLNWKYINKDLIVGNALRNDLIVRIAQGLIKIGKNPLILIAQIAHGITLSTLISKGGYRVAMITGNQHVTIYQDGIDIEEYHDTDNTVFSEFITGRIDALIGTSVLDEGADIPSLSSVILAGGGKSPLKVVQRVGRGLRPKPDDNTTWIIDFLDNFNVVTKSHFQKRNAILSSLGMSTYQVINTNDIDRTLAGYKELLVNKVSANV